MSDRYPCGTLKRRGFLGAAAAAAATPWFAGKSSRAEGPQDAAGATPHGPKPEKSKFDLPGLYPGRVVEVKNAAMIKEGKKDRAAIKASLDKGLTSLTGADDAVGAWKTFFEPGDVVGIKVVPNGFPYAFSSHELVLETIEGLKAAGVKTKDIFVYERFRGEMQAAGYDKILPADVRWGGLTAGDAPQIAMEFDGFRDDPIAGYDRDAFIQMDLVHYGDDPKDDRQYRSHLGKLLTKVVNKVVAIPCLKDHRSAGVTGALKNISHGSVNNVARSHANNFTNACNQFIPQVVSHPILKSKFVLQIMDGVRGVYHGGPTSVQNGRWTWDNNALLLATDPVALDRIEWKLIDARRAAANLPPVAASGKTALDPAGIEGFDVRQPQHIALAGTLGLGTYLFEGKGPLIKHDVVTV
ncbi:DUF362 domain-containing protein [Paludisphaera mucosa]|uniref:DUF362 domain-containing protein n=1 Tax=Paludisphaera mucosa TaxID=3030827 RepID=A0ABT6FD91_9BACT|nr:DUF362 domain-containing protein [Paludisphaera mucosa]MDG3005558.1 DUF362 domain-containing protein [Paludisphaera mucosa]